LELFSGSQVADYVITNKKTVNEMKKVRDISHYRPVVLTPKINRSHVVCLSQVTFSFISRKFSMVYSPVARAE